MSTNYRCNICSGILPQYQTPNTVLLSDSCGCTQPNTVICSEVIPVGIVSQTNCDAIACSEGCEETIKATCVVLDDYCLLEDCNCNNEPVSLQAFITKLCSEIDKIKQDINCLKQFIPSCNVETTCIPPSFTNITF